MKLTVRVGTAVIFRQHKLTDGAYVYIKSTKLSSSGVFHVTEQDNKTLEPFLLHFSVVLRESGAGGGGL